MEGNPKKYTVRVQRIIKKFTNKIKFKNRSEIRNGGGRGEDYDFYGF